MSASAQRLRAWPWHVFGRGPDGYATLAADPALDPKQARRLERYAWGQTGDPAYGASLAADPALWIEPWSEQVVVSRVLRGAPDLAGRETLAFHSLVIPRDEYLTGVRHEFAAWCRDPRTWRRSLAAVGATSELTKAVAQPASVERVARLRRALEEHVGTATSLVVPPGDASLDDLAALLTELPSSQVGSLSLAHRALTDALPCGLVVLDPAHRPEPAEHSRAVLESGTGRSIPRAARAVPASAARSPRVPPRRRPAVPAVSSRTPELTMNRTVATAFAVLAVLILILGLANLQVQWGNAARVVETDTVRDATLADRLTGFEERLDALETAASAESRALEGRLTALEQRLAAVDGALRQVAAAIAALEAQQSADAPSAHPRAAGEDSDEVDDTADVDRQVDAQNRGSGQESSR